MPLEFPIVHYVEVRIRTEYCTTVVSIYASFVPRGPNIPGKRV